MNIYHLLLFILSILSGIPRGYGQGDYAIIGVAIPSLEIDALLIDQTVLISDGMITDIGDASGIQIPDDATQIDGNGRYLVPGIAEMHAHIPTPQDGSDENVRETLFLYLANGITTIRGMLGHPYHLALKTYIETDAFPSPRIYTSSPSLNGNTVPTKEEAINKVTQYAEDGYDFLKIHPGIKREVFDELVKTANEVGIPFAGHVPMDVGIRHAIESKYASIDHLDGYITGLAPEEKKAEGGFFGVLLYDDLDLGKIDELVNSTLVAGIAIVPTQTLMTRWLSPKPAAEMVGEPEMKYIPASQRFTWRQSKERMLENLAYSPKGYEHFVETREKILQKMHQAGVTILMGSDAPQVFNVPGFSIHHEMKDMTKMGMSNREILRSGSVDVAAYFQRDDFGTIEAGQIADLVLLEQNPVEDISNMQTIAGVMYRGRWLPKEKIEEKLKLIAEKYQ